ncbi:MAG: hypothetical protein FJY37_06720 [Betaproteobacteria bacterium]|nr:hypothetical protein [Betaproteobacteria bacterium]
MARAIIRWGVAVCMAACSIMGSAQGLSQIKLEDNEEEARKSLHDRILARGFEATIEDNVVIYTHQNMVTNIRPLVFPGEFDRLLVSTWFNAKEAYRTGGKLKALAVELNAAQNMLRVFATDDGSLAISGSMTFVDVLSAREFDLFMDLYGTVIRQHILTPEALDILD